ncbi:hypothetical protein JCM11251_004358 [Rhodosporidiobolus azoricus]
MERTVRALTRHYPHRDQVVTQALPVLEQYPGLLNPEQADFTYDDGRVELLLSLQGVLPVPIGSNTYHCPIAFWLPLDFPAKPPVVFIVPSETLAVKKGKHVDPSGRVNVGYLEQWARKAEGCSLMNLISDLIPIFSASYPVRTIQPKPRGQAVASPAPPPPHPPQAGSSSSPAPPPPRPPVPPQLTGSPIPGASSSSYVAPPRPPPPPQMGPGGRPLSMTHSDGGRAASPAVGSADMPPRPPLPPGASARVSIGISPQSPPPLPPALPGSFVRFPPLHLFPLLMPFLTPIIQQSSQPPGPPPAYPAQPPPPPALPHSLSHAHPNRSSTLGFPPQPPQLPPTTPSPAAFAAGSPPPMGPPQPPHFRPPQQSVSPRQSMTGPPGPPAFGGSPAPPQPPTFQHPLQPPQVVASPLPPASQQFQPVQQQQPQSPPPPEPLPLPGTASDYVRSPPPPQAARPPSPSQPTVRSFSPAPSSVGTAGQHNAQSPRSSQAVQREASTRRPLPNSQQSHQYPDSRHRQPSSAQGSYDSYASSPAPLAPQQHRLPASSRHPIPPQQPAHTSASHYPPQHAYHPSSERSYSPSPSEATASYAPPVPIVSGAHHRPPPPESVYSVASGTQAGEYGSYMPPTTATPSMQSVAGEEEQETQTPVDAQAVYRQEMRPVQRKATAYYRAQERDGYTAQQAEEEGGGAFEPVSEGRMPAGGRPGLPPRQAQQPYGRRESIESAAYSVGRGGGGSYAPYGQPPLPPQMPASRMNGHHDPAHEELAYPYGYGGYPGPASSAGSYHGATASPYGLPPSHLKQPPYLPSPPPPPPHASANVASPTRAARRPKPPRAATVAAFNILDAADDDLSSPTTAPSPSSPSVASYHPQAGPGGGAPPPVPPNPSLLALRTRVHSKLSSSLSALHSTTQAHLSQLDLMRLDLEKAQPAIEDEMARLEAVRAVCQGVKERYEMVVGEGEGRMREYEGLGEGKEVDELVCGRTVVYVQLLDLVAEDAALEDTLYALSRGLNSGGDANIDLDRFLRTTRRLAKEQFVLRATINKILLGLAIRRERTSSARRQQVQEGGRDSNGASGRGTPVVAGGEV